MKKLLVVVPYRDRENHLKEFAPYITETLDKRNIPYKLVIVEQNQGKLFNRGLLCNIGFSLYHKDYDYVCFHDVDMICSEIDYSYADKPTSLLRSRTKVGKVHGRYFGGITIFPNDIFKEINGFSNNFWGWGGEDDDLYDRCNLITKIKPGHRFGVCTDLETVSNETNRNNNPNYRNNVKYWKKPKSIEDIQADGLSQVNDCFKLVKTSIYDQYTLVSIFAL